MKNLIKKVPTFTFGMVVGVVMTAGGVAGATNFFKASPSSVSIIVDNQSVELSEKPMVVNNRLYLPVRDISNALGYSVSSVTNSKVNLSKGYVAPKKDITRNTTTTKAKTLTEKEIQDKLEQIEIRKKIMEHSSSEYREAVTKQIELTKKLQEIYLKKSGK